jgi:hypothetical protein
MASPRQETGRDPKAVSVDNGYDDGHDDAERDDGPAGGRGAGTPGPRRGVEGHGNPPGAERRVPG